MLPFTPTRCALPDRTTRTSSTSCTENTLKVRDELPQLKVRMFKKNDALWPSQQPADSVAAGPNATILRADARVVVVHRLLDV